MAVALTMFIRRETKVMAGGERRTYVSLAHNVRERMPNGDSRPKPVIFARLGREEDLDVDTVVQMRDALDRYLRKRFGDEADGRSAVDDAATDVRAKLPALEVLASRAFGMRVVVEHCWNELGLRKALERVEAEHGTSFPFERIVFSMILNRLVDPTSKRACNEWVCNEAWMPELADSGVQHFYRALDLMERHTDRILGAVGDVARADCSPDELSFLLCDTTSSYTESEYDDAERKQILDEWRAFSRGEGDQPSMPRPQVVNDPPLRMRGHSKDHRPREPQVKLGLVRTASGRVVDMQVVAGNVHDQRLTIELFTAARARMGDGVLVAVMDSGMGGNANLKALDEAGFHRVSAVPLRSSKVAEEHLLSKSGRWARHPHRPGFQVRHTVLAADVSPSGRPEIWVATRNEHEASRQNRLLDKEISRIEAALAEDDRIDGHGRPVCTLLSTRNRERLIRRHAREDRYILDRDRIRLERRRAGVHVLRSTLVDHPVATTLEAYDEQYAIEGDFRTLKTPLRLRPMHHRADRRIRAHMLMCGLALVVLRELERRTGMTLEGVQRAIGRVRATQLRQGKTEFWQREEWSADALQVLHAVGASEGPTRWGAKRVLA